jgi:hypothetical protein
MYHSDDQSAIIQMIRIQSMFSECFVYFVYLALAGTYRMDFTYVH